jgi:hypothetical protein
MSDNKDSLNWKFYALLTGASIGFISGIYYIYSLFNDIDSDLSDDQKEKLEELVKISENLNQNHSEESGSSTKKKESDSTFAIKVFRQINELSEEMFLKDYPNWIQIRRNLLKENNKPEYYSYCENILSEKMRIESKAAEMILNKLGMTQIELQTMMEKINQNEYTQLQQEMLQKSQLTIKNPEKLTNDDVIKAFKEFLHLKNEMDAESRNMGQFMNDPSDEARMMFFIKLEINKYMIDDYLFNLFEIDFSALMMLINTRQLYSDSQIASDYQRLMQDFNQAQSY